VGEGAKRRAHALSMGCIRVGFAPLSPPYFFCHRYGEKFLDKSPHFRYMYYNRISLTEGRIPDAIQMRSECGARARSRKPLPGGSGPLLDRHDDRSPRSAVDSRQIEAGNAR
jgi:hypothetical protein